MKEKENKNIVYALADYKQLVMGYRTKYAQLAKEVIFWKVSFVWFIMLVLCLSGALFFLFTDTKNRLVQSSNTISLLNRRIESVSLELDKERNELEAAKADLFKKDQGLREMEKNMSTSSKKILDKLLKGQDHESPADAASFMPAR